MRGSARTLAFSCGLLLFPVAGGAQSTTPGPFPAVVLRPAPTPTPSLTVGGNLDAPVDRREKTAFEAISGEVQTIFEKCKGAVVRIEATDAFGTTAGTGFFIDPAGTIYTHYSVAGGSWNLLVDFAGKKYPATCLLADVHTGVAILNIKAGETPFLPLCKSFDLKMASAVVAIGYPMDYPATPTFGLVAGFDQGFAGHDLATTHIRANVPVQMGEAGAPLLNDKGEVVGILMYQFDFGRVCLSLPIQAAEKVRMDYLRFGYLRPAWIGVNVKPVSGEEEAAVRVDGVTEDGPAARSGVRAGDTIVGLNRKPVRRLADMVDAAFFLTADATVPITVLRDEKEVTLSVHAMDPPGMSMSLPPVRQSEPNGLELIPVPRDLQVGKGTGP